MVFQVKLSRISSLLSCSQFHSILAIVSLRNEINLYMRGSESLA